MTKYLRSALQEEAVGDLNTKMVPKCQASQVSNSLVAFLELKLERFC